MQWCNYGGHGPHHSHQGPPIWLVIVHNKCDGKQSLRCHPLAPPPQTKVCTPLAPPPPKQKSTTSVTTLDECDMFSSFFLFADKPGSHQMPCLFKVCWVLYNISTPAAFCVSILYWSMLYSRELLFCNNPPVSHQSIDKRNLTLNNLPLPPAILCRSETCMSQLPGELGQRKLLASVDVAQNGLVDGYVTNMRQPWEKPGVLKLKLLGSRALW